MLSIKFSFAFETVRDGIDFEANSFTNNGRVQ